MKNFQILGVIVALSAVIISYVVVSKRKIQKNEAAKNSLEGKIQMIQNQDTAKRLPDNPNKNIDYSKSKLKKISSLASHLVGCNRFSCRRHGDLVRPYDQRSDAADIECFSLDRKSVV